MTNHEIATGQDEETNREIAASANRIDTIIAVFAFGVMLGMWIA